MSIELNELPLHASNLGTVSMMYNPVLNKLVILFQNYSEPVWCLIAKNDSGWYSSPTYERLLSYRRVEALWTDAMSIKDYRRDLLGYILVDSKDIALSHFFAKSDKSAFYAQSELINVDENTSCYYLATIKADGITVDKYTIANASKESV